MLATARRWGWGHDGVRSPLCRGLERVWTALGLRGVYRGKHRSRLAHALWSVSWAPAGHSSANIGTTRGAQQGIARTIQRCSTGDLHEDATILQDNVLTTWLVCQYILEADADALPFHHQVSRPAL